MSKFTNRADLLIAAGESIKMQEAAGVLPLVKCHGEFPTSIAEIYFIDPPHCYEFPLAVVEGKPVFVGDELYSKSSGIKMKALDTWREMDVSLWSWNPPKPKTVMVELLREDAEYWVNLSASKLPEIGTYNICSNRFYDACRKALEKA